MTREQVAILRTGESTEDAYGQQVAGATTEATVVCLVAPGDSEEQLRQQSSVAADFTVYAPPGTVVGASDRVRIRGDVHAVDGKPADWLGAGVVIRVTRSAQEG